MAFRTKIFKKDPKISDLNAEIADLGAVISRLKDEKSELDSVVLNHEARKVDVSKLESTMSDLSGQIRQKKTDLTALDREFSALSAKKNETVEILSNLESSVREKNGYVADIEKYKNIARNANDDMILIQQNVLKMKKIGEAEVSKVKNEIRIIRDNLSQY